MVKISNQTDIPSQRYKNGEKWVITRPYES